MTSVNAQLLSDTIYCDEMEFTYTSRAPNITATFAVIWGQSKPLDNPDNIHVLIYRCKEMANNCGMCLSLDEKYQCGWCQVGPLNFFLPVQARTGRLVPNFNLGQTQLFPPNSVCCKAFRGHLLIDFEVLQISLWLLKYVEGKKNRTSLLARHSSLNAGSTLEAQQWKQMKRYQWIAKDTFQLANLLAGIQILEYQCQ